MSHTIGVFFGGKSPEHDVSIITGQFIISGLKKLGKKVVPVYLDMQGAWFLGEKLGNIKYFTQGDTVSKSDPEGLGEYYLDMQKSRGKLVFQKKGFFRKEVIIDLGFPAFHGPNGEDGMIQGLFETFDLPYVGCGVASSAVAMDKVLTKQFYQAEGIPTTKFLSYWGSDWKKNKPGVIPEIINSLKFPIFVKPAHLGSSIGITKVLGTTDLENAIDLAFYYDNHLVVEEGVEHLMDVTCAVIGTDQPIASELQESVFSDALFSYEDKYLTDGGTQLGSAQKNIIIPARLDANITTDIKETAMLIFQKLGCSGMARFDFLYNKATREFYANEINPLPGTLYHHLWKASGIEFLELLEKLLQFAESRHAEKNNITYTFASSILEQANSIKLNLKKDV